MQARKCDRCGALCEYPGYVADVAIVVYKQSYGRVYVDLCDKCQEYFLSWLTKPGVFVPPKSTP